MAQILDRIEVLQPFIDRYRKAIESGEPALTGRNTIPLRTFCRMPVSKEVPDYSTINKLAKRFGAEAVEAMNKELLFQDGVQGHQRHVGEKAKEAATDRGFYSPRNETFAETEGIRVAMPKPGKKSRERIAYEKEPWFKRLQRFRAGMEAIISNANRRSGLCKPRTRGTRHTECSVGWSVFAYNLAMAPRVKTG